MIDYSSMKSTQCGSIIRIVRFVARMEHCDVRRFITIDVSLHLLRWLLQKIDCVRQTYHKITSTGLNRYQPVIVGLTKARPARQTVLSGCTSLASNVWWRSLLWTVVTVGWMPPTWCETLSSFETGDLELAGTWRSMTAVCVAAVLSYNARLTSTAVHVSLIFSRMPGCVLPSCASVGSQLCLGKCPRTACIEIGNLCWNWYGLERWWYTHRSHRSPGTC